MGKTGQLGFKAVRIETVNRRIATEQVPTPSLESVTELSVAKTIAQTQSGSDTGHTRIEKKPSNDWRDQAVQIFNQGDTVILEFGYERR